MNGAAWIPAAVIAVSIACLDAERPVPARLCQTPGDPLVTVRGLQTSGFDSRSLARNTEVDASTAWFVTPTDIPVYVGGGASICFYGGVVIGSLPAGTPYDRMHDTYGLVAHGTAFQLEGFRVFDYGDGVSIFFFQAEDGIRDTSVTGVQTCALPICLSGGTVHE